MYDFVYNSEVSPYRNLCTNILCKLRNCLNEDYGIIIQPILVGFGAKNMVMRYGNAPFDLDYNLQIIKMPDEYRDNLFRLKNTVINSLNRIVCGTRFCNGFTSDFAIKSLLYSENALNAIFRFNLDIITKNKHGDYCCLISQIGLPTWCEIPSSKDIEKKAVAVKKLGYWSDARKAYKELKNRHSAHNSSSFTLYVEAVNLIYLTLQSNTKGRNITGKVHGVSGHTHTQAQLNDYANQNNPNNPAYKANRNNHANQCNHNSNAYKSNRNNCKK